MTQVLVTGASGGLGSLVVPMLRTRGMEVSALSRRQHADADGVHWMRGDVVRGTGLAEAVAGVSVVLHLAGGARGDDIAARNISAAAAHAGVAHLLLISVIGADLMPVGYFRAKAAAEDAVAASGAPWTILRAAQFHTFVERAVKGMTSGPIAIAPRDLRFEPVDAHEVAKRLADLVGGDPSGRVADLAGPEVLSADQLVRSWASHRGRSARVWRPGLPGAVGRAYRDGLNLAGPDVDRGTGTWGEHLRASLAGHASI